MFLNMIGVRHLPFTFYAILCLISETLSPDKVIVTDIIITVMVITLIR